MKNLIYSFIGLLMGFSLIFSSCAKDDTAFLISDDQTEMVTVRKDAVVPFKGFYITYPQIVGPPDENGAFPIYIWSEGKATHLGNSTWEGFQLVIVTANPHQIEGVWTTFTAANGDQLMGWYDGEGTTNSEGIIEFSGTVYIEEGTGRFEGVTGELPFEGWASFTQGELTFEDGYLEY